MVFKALEKLQAVGEVDSVGLMAVLSWTSGGAILTIQRG